MVVCGGVWCVVCGVWCVVCVWCVVVWWCGGVVVWWCGGVVVWWCGGVVVWWCGGVVCSVWCVVCGVWLACFACVALAGLGAHFPSSAAGCVLLVVCAQITPVFHFPYSDGKYDEGELPNIVRNVSLLGGLVVVRATAYWRPHYRKQD